MSWPVVDSGQIAHTEYVSLHYDDVIRPDGETARYYYVDSTDSVAVVAHDRSADELVMLEQYRPTLGRDVINLPGGGLDGDSPEAAARRELSEETGFQADRVETLGAYQPTGRSRMTRHVCYATQLTPGEPAPDDGEFLTVRRRDPETVLAGEEPFTGWTLTPILWAREEGLL